MSIPRYFCIISYRLLDKLSSFNSFRVRILAPFSSFTESHHLHTNACRLSIGLLYDIGEGGVGFGVAGSGIANRLKQE
jgi:hypothetical protein